MDHARARRKGLIDRGKRRSKPPGDVRSPDTARAWSAFLVLALALGGCAGARWTAGDTFTESAVALTAAGDYLQTRQICADMDRGTNADWVYETNPILGARCERMPPAIYFSTVMAAHVGAARLMPPVLRRVFQLATIGFQVHALERNHVAGYSVRW